VATAAASPAASAASAAVKPAALDAEALHAVFNTQLRGEADAWRELASAWGLNLASAADPCATAAREGLPCFKGPGSLALVRQLNRPALLVLRDTDNKSYHVLLTALAADSATLRRGSASVTVPLATLGTAWRGEYGTFWRAPAGYAGPGSLTSANAEATDWLNARLDQALPHDGSTPPAGAASLSSRVAAFQVAQGLPPDGVAGPLTVMLLNRATGLDEPRLLAAGH
jgi:general secretion pathway protein A